MNPNYPATTPSAVAGGGRLSFSIHRFSLSKSIPKKHLKLTEEEEEIIVCDEEAPSEKAEQVVLCLLGKLNTTNYFNPGAMKMVLKNIWKPSHGVYVKLPDFCYACGKLGHVYQGCALFDENIPETELQYGDFPRASPIKPKGKTVEANLMDERRLVHAIRNKKKSS
ncbi:hypothetical protein Cgig2_025404 [Carnegiea gigantea]|uniref:CCHC-type domain-containing protein n=1 Tax=Carnegiea gigantea TaxID=171969 RepID=A0A9Q1K0C5_9CARY|nr:hypothetical protein Cgig2_025404 [Carnegiea gigantea]